MARSKPTPKSQQPPLWDKKLQKHAPWSKSKSKPSEKRLSMKEQVLSAILSRERRLNKGQRNRGITPTQLRARLQERYSQTKAVKFNASRLNKAETSLIEMGVLSQSNENLKLALTAKKELNSSVQGDGDTDVEQAAVAFLKSKGNAARNSARAASSVAPKKSSTNTKKKSTSSSNTSFEIALPSHLLSKSSTPKSSKKSKKSSPSGASSALLRLTKAELTKLISEKDEEIDSLQLDKQKVEDERDNLKARLHEEEGNDGDVDGDGEDIIGDIYDLSEFEEDEEEMLVEAEKEDEEDEEEVDEEAEKELMLFEKERERQKKAISVTLAEDSMEVDEEIGEGEKEDEVVGNGGDSGDEADQEEEEEEEEGELLGDKSQNPIVGTPAPEFPNDDEDLGGYDDTNFEFNDMLFDDEVPERSTSPPATEESRFIQEQQVVSTPPPPPSQNKSYTTAQQLASPTPSLHSNFVAQRASSTLSGNEDDDDDDEQEEGRAPIIGLPTPELSSPVQPTGGNALSLREEVAALKRSKSLLAQELSEVSEYFQSNRYQLDQHVVELASVQHSKSLLEEELSSIAGFHQIGHKEMEAKIVELESQLASSVVKQENSNATHVEAARVATEQAASLESRLRECTDELVASRSQEATLKGKLASNETFHTLALQAKANHIHRLEEEKDAVFSELSDTRMNLEIMDEERMFINEHHEAAGQHYENFAETVRDAFGLAQLEKKNLMGSLRMEKERSLNLNTELETVAILYRERESEYHKLAEALQELKEQSSSDALDYQQLQQRLTEEQNRLSATRQSLLDLATSHCGTDPYLNSATTEEIFKRILQTLVNLKANLLQDRMKIYHFEKEIKSSTATSTQMQTDLAKLSDENRVLQERLRKFEAWYKSGSGWMKEGSDLMKS